MTTPFTISPEHRSELLKFLKKTPTADAVIGYCAFIESKYRVKPVLYPRDRTIYRSIEDLSKRLESEGKLWRESEITIHFGKQSVNAETVKIYICPFCSYVIGNNMSSQPVDDMYDHLSLKCKNNTERVDGLPAKRFLVSEDLDLIKEHITERKAAVKKKVYTSASGKLFNSKEAVIEDFKKAVKVVPFSEVVYNPREFEIEESLNDLKDEQVTGEKIEAFLQALSKYTEFDSYVKRCQEA